MTDTTVNRMNLLIQRNSKHINAKVPEDMKTLILKFSKKYNMTESQYIKLAISERLDKDMEK
jgi:predicted DNA-binding protein